MFQPTPKKKRGIADRIRDALAGNAAGMEARRQKFAPRHPSRAATDLSRFVPKTEFVDNTLADRVERQQRGAMKPDSFDRKFGRFGRR